MNYRGSCHCGRVARAARAATVFALALAAHCPALSAEQARPLEAGGLSNFYKVSDSLYRSAQPTAEGFRSLKELSITTVVNLRSFNSDRKEIGSTGLAYEHIYMKAWHPERKEIVRFLQIVTDPRRQPVLVHCQHGSDRTGTMVAVYRIVVEGWSKETAVAEMTSEHFGFHRVWTNLPKWIQELDVEAIRQEAGIASTAIAASADTTAHVLPVAGLQRTYYLHAPPTLPASKVLPLVLVFHGGSGTATHIERETKFSELADREGFLVAYPQGYEKSWNDGRGVSDIPAQHDRIDDAAFIEALIADVSSKRQVDPRRIYATGISNGAMFSNFLGGKLAAQLAAIAPVAGGLPEPLLEHFEPAQPVSVLILNGTDDRFVPYGGGKVQPPRLMPRGRVLGAEQTARLWTERNGGDRNREPAVETLPDRDPKDGCRVKKLAFARGRNGSEVVLFRMEGAGHTWPDGSQYLPKHLVGRVCRDFNATEVIWQFFLSHPKP